MTDCIVVSTPFANVRVVELDGEKFCSAADIAGMFQYKKPKDACEILCDNLRSVHLRFPNGKMITRAFVDFKDFMTLADHSECMFKFDAISYFKNKVYEVQEETHEEPAIPVKQEESATVEKVFVEPRICEHQIYGKVRTATINEEMWWVAKDVCDVLGFSNPTLVLGRLRNDERSKCKMKVRGTGDVNIVNAEGLKSLVEMSKVPFAHHYYEWLSSLVTDSAVHSQREAKADEPKEEVSKDTSNALTIINEQEVLGKQFRIFGSPEEPYFLAKDVADWIEHSNARMMLKAVDEDEKLCVNNLYALKGQQEQWFLTEDGLYEVLMQSRKPIAKAFKKQVKEILKSIRKHGGYIAGQETLSDEQLMAKALLVADSKIKERDALIEKQNVQIAEQNNLIEGQASYIKEVKPKEEFYDAVAESDGTISVAELAKFLIQNGINIGRNRLFEWLVENGYLMKKKNRYEPRQLAMANGYFKLVEYYVPGYYGGNKVQYTVRVTPKGQQHLMKKLLKQNA